MKKIGVATWYKNGNFGGTLQAIAMSKTLTSLGFTCEMIDYRPFRPGKNVLLRLARRTVFSLLYPTSYRSRIQILRDVDTFLTQSPTLSNWEDLCVYSACYDWVICGSDQIWNSVRGCSPFYFLQFAPEEKRIAYAPSIGLNDVDEPYRTQFKTYVASIPHLSVREFKGAELIEHYSGRMATVVVDPVYLLTKEQWRDYYRGSYIPNLGRYVLCYFMTETTAQMRTAKAVADKMGCKLVAVSCKQHTRVPCTRIACNTQEFLNLIDHAELLLTDSFHGCSFGILLETQTRAFMRFSELDPMCQNSRLEAIFSRFALGNIRVNIRMSPDEIVGHAADLEKVKRLVAEEREQSLAYLSGALALEDYKLE